MIDAELDQSVLQKHQDSPSFLPCLSCKALQSAAKFPEEPCAALGSRPSDAKRTPIWSEWIACVMTFMACRICGEVSAFLRSAADCIPSGKSAQSSAFAASSL